MPVPFTIRRFAEAEWGLLREVRLEALQDTPEAFGWTYAAESARPPEAWQRWLDSTATFGVFQDGRARGLASFSHAQASNLRHRGSLGAMYLAPELRGSGAAGALVEAVLDHARGLVEQVHLSAVASNERAVRFYRRMQFVEYGREPGGLRHAGVDYDVLLMVRLLARGTR